MNPWLTVLGAANSYEADVSWSTDTDDLYLLSVRYLDKAVLYSPSFTYSG